VVKSFKTGLEPAA